MRQFVCVILLVSTCPVAEAQVCRLSVAGLNRNRRVMGPVNAECPFSLHSPPFGNWGVTSTFGEKSDSRQFEGWCRNTYVCDNNGNCSIHCRDGWYEWNSCTEDPQFRPPNATLYNSDNGTQQVTVTGINVHGTRTVDVRVSCPLDTNGDGVADTGGCSEVGTYRSGVNFMSLYELDPGTADDLIQTMYFPEAILDTGCGIWSCPSAATEWLEPAGYDSPVSPARVYAEVAVLINSGIFLDTSRLCAVSSLRADVVSGASFLPGPVAPESIASAFGQGLAVEIAVATSTPLPTALGGTTVNVIDSAGTSRPAPLFYVSPDQINFQVPGDTAAGAARVVIARADGIRSQATVRIEAVAPGIFTANADGRGVPAAMAVRVAADWTQTTVPVFQCELSGTNCLATPIDLGPDTDQIVLVLFGTGIRFHGGGDSVQMRIGGLPADVLYAGAQGQFVGLDQVNVLVPRELRGAGVVDVELIVNGRAANTVQIGIQ